MFYDFSFTIPANTSQDSPKRYKCKLTHGVIHRIEIGFPPGCAGLAGLKINEGLHQLWPTNPEGAFNTDGYTIVINEYYELYRAPYMLTLIGWNDDDTYPHTLEVRFGILPQEIIAPEETFIQAFKKLLKRLRL